MARPEHDSHLEIRTPLSSDSGRHSDIDSRAVLDLTSRGPLPPDVNRLLDGRDDPRDSRPRVPATGAVTVGDVRMWLDGGALLCACPDCDAPMSVRMWLMVADCWQCGTSIELTEEQEHEAKRLLAEKTPSRGPASHADLPRTLPVAPKRAPDEKPAREPPRQEPTSRRVGPMPDPPRRATPPSPPSRIAPPLAPAAPTAGSPVSAHRRLHRIRDLFHDMPAWLVSLVFHLVLLTLLALITFDENNDPRQITLSLAVSRQVRPGDTEALLSRDMDQFDLPIAQERPLSDRDRRAIALAEQDARRLRIDPGADDLNLPDLARVKQTIGSRSDSPRRTLALRDPRVRRQLVQREGGTTWTEAAVARGLRWMAVHQQSDGSWSLNRFHRHPDCHGRCSGRGRTSSDVAATSLVLLPFLGAGQTHLTGYYKDVVSAGLRWLLEHQRPNGDLRSGSSREAAMYAHGQATIVLCEALGMTQDEVFRQPAQRAVDFIVDAQHPAGGWRYRPLEAGDTSVLGWQLMALQSARAAGLDVPDETLETAGHFLDRVQYQGGALYAYQPKHRPSPSMTAEGLLCRVYLGWKRHDPGLVQGIDYLVDHLPSEQDTNFYYWYYATQVMHHFGGDPWEAWNLHMREVLVSTQETKGHEAGSWHPRGGHAHTGGRLYATSLAVCALEVYYRHAPIFRQIKLD